MVLGGRYLCTEIIKIGVIEMLANCQSEADLRRVCRFNCSQLYYVYIMYSKKINYTYSYTDWQKTSNRS